MAYIIPNPNQTNTAPFTPTGNEPSNAVSFSLPFNGPAVFNPVYSNKDALKSNLINWFLTNKGERILNPNFGANLRAYIFEAINTNTFDVLEMKIKEDINNYFPMVNIQDLQVLGSEEFQRVKIILTYFSIDSNNPDTVDLTFQ
tara:strand:- start:375 stop:806 length:432 start_codon:yes stop_codon:yes gene_type:complete